MNETLYDQDLYSWTRQQANLLRQHKFDKLDLFHLVEELEDSGNTSLRPIGISLDAVSCPFTQVAGSTLEANKQLAGDYSSAAHSDRQVTPMEFWIEASSGGGNG